jgi:hypothetical protein
MTDRICLTCSNWDARGVPRFAFRMGKAFCVVKRTQAVTLAHWRGRESWSPASVESVESRLEWLARLGVKPKINPPTTTAHD